MCGSSVGMPWPTPRSLKIQVGFAASSPSFARSFLTKLRTSSTLGLDAAAVRLDQALTDDQPEAAETR
ncbi:MAG: hypothetical protein OXO48_01670 [Caldilineaceae bacterium]|nr:hypothetical protein [Caldilineaceae bacterium]